MDCCEQDDVNFRGNDPGATKYGNFINYYQFHLPKCRITSLPSNVWHAELQKHFICLDVGCNSGDLTQELYSFISAEVKLEQEKCANVIDKDNVTQCYFLGIDLDPTLIERAEENNKYVNEIKYKCINFMAEERSEIVHDFLKLHCKSTFDVVFCFSLTMWIHLNEGDEGLRKFLKDVCAIAKILVIEPQPWHCYKRAVRRLKRASKETFPLFETLEIRDNVELEIENIVVNDCHFKKIVHTPTAVWGRRIAIYERSEVR